MPEKRVLITGAGGFVGKHLLTYLSANTDWLLFGNAHSRPGSFDLPRLQWVTLDLTDREQTEAVLWQRPARLRVPPGRAKQRSTRLCRPQGTIINNVVSQLNLLDVLRVQSPETRVMIACSSEQYGLVRPEDQPIDEDTPFRPNNPYAVSKIAQDALALQYFLSYGQPTIRVRSFNHIGPGQSEQFVTAAFALQVASHRSGQAGTRYVRGQPGRRARFYRRARHGARLSPLHYERRARRSV